MFLGVQLTYWQSHWKSSLFTQHQKMLPKSSKRGQYLHKQPIVCQSPSKTGLDVYHLVLKPEVSSIKWSSLLWAIPKFASKLSILNAWSSATCKNSSRIHYWLWSELGWISRVTTTIQKIFDIHWYSSRDSTANNRLILVSSSRREISTQD